MRVPRVGVTILAFLLILLCYLRVKVLDAYDACCGIVEVEG